MRLAKEAGAESSVKAAAVNKKASKESSGAPPPNKKSRGGAGVHVPSVAPNRLKIMLSKFLESRDKGELDWGAHVSPTDNKHKFQSRAYHNMKKAAEEKGCSKEVCTASCSASDSASWYKLFAMLNLLAIFLARGPPSSCKKAVRFAKTQFLALPTCRGQRQGDAPLLGGVVGPAHGGGLGGVSWGAVWRRGALQWGALDGAGPSRCLGRSGQQMLLHPP